MRGHYTLLTPWLASLKPFHFRGKLLIARENGAVIGGQGILLFGWGPLKLACIPFGPILDQGHEARIKELLQATIEEARRLGAAALQMQPSWLLTDPADESIVTNACLPVTAVGGAPALPPPWEQGRLLDSTGGAR